MHVKAIFKGMWLSMHANKYTVRMTFMTSHVNDVKFLLFVCVVFIYTIYIMS